MKKWKYFTVFLYCLIALFFAASFYLRFFHRVKYGSMASGVAWGAAVIFPLTIVTTDLYREGRTCKNTVKKVIHYYIFLMVIYLFDFLI